MLLLIWNGERKFSVSGAANTNHSLLETMPVLISQQVGKVELKFKMKNKKVKVVRKGTYLKHWKIPVIVKKRLPLSQHCILAQTLGE